MYANSRSAHRASNLRTHARALSLLACAALVVPACGTTPAHSRTLPPSGWREAASVRSAAAGETAQAAEAREGLLAVDAEITLAELIELAVAQSPAIRAARARLDASLERGPQVDSLPNPKLRGKLFLEEVETRVGPQEWAVGIEQQLPAFGVLGARRKSADARAQAEAARLDFALLEVVREVKLAWYELYFLGRAIESVREDRDRLKSLESVIRRDYASGSIPYTFLIRAQVELGRSENRLAGLQDQRQPARARLNAVLHRPSDAEVPTPIELSEPGELLPTGELMALLESASPLLTSLRHEKRAAEEDRAGSELASRPAYSVGLEYIETGSAVNSTLAGSGDDPLVAMFSVELPIRRSRYSAVRREAAARSRMASADLDTTIDRLRSQLEQEHFVARDAERQITLYEETLLPRARQAFDATETAFRSGQTGFLELIDAERVLLEFQLSLERARTDRALAEARLEALVGASVSSPTTPPESVTTVDSVERSL